MRRTYNELKSIVVTPVAPMHPYTCVPLHVYTCVGGTHDTIWAYDDREIGRSMITDGGERRTEVTRGVEKEDGYYGRAVERQEGWRDGGGWCRKSEGNVSSLASPLFLSLSLSLSLCLSPFRRRRGTETEVDGRRNHTRLTLVEPRSKSCCPRLKSLHLRTCIESARVRCRSKGIG